MASFEAEAGKILSKPYLELRPDQQRERQALARRVERAILQDPEVPFRSDANGVVSLVGGSMDNAGEVMAAVVGVKAYAADVLRRARAMQLFMPQTLRFPRTGTRGRPCAMDAEAGLNAQIEHLQSNCNVPLGEGTVLGYEVGMTGDGKGMQVANCSPDGKCWSCDDHDNVEPVEGIN